MKAIFFDVDGVLNSNKFICNHPGETVDRKNVKNLASIVKATNAKLVAVCNWRKKIVQENVSDERAKELISKLAEEGLAICDITPSGDQISEKYKNYGRCFEVKEYVDTHDIESMVILDDMDPDWDAVGLGDCWVNTENATKGLSETDVKRAIDILNQNP